MARALFALALLAVLAASHVAFARAEEAAISDIANDPDFQGPVRQLNATNFLGFVTSHDLVLVTFFSKSKDSSSLHMTVVGEAADALSNENGGEDIAVGKVDLDEEGNKRLLNIYDIKDTPHSIIIKAKKWETPRVYEGPWDCTGLQTVLKRLEGPAVKELPSAEDAVDNLLLNEGFLVVAYVEDTDSKEFKTFSAVAEMMRHEFSFRYTSNASALSFLSDTISTASLPSVRIVSSSDRSVLDSTDFEQGALTYFLWSNSVPLVTELSRTHTDYFISTRAHRDTSTSKVYLFANYSNGESPAYRFAYTMYAETKPEGVVFFMGSTDDNAETIKKFGLSPESSPLIIVAHRDGSISHRTSIKPEEVKEFLDSALAGKAAAAGSDVNGTSVESVKEAEELAEEAAAASINLSVSAPGKDEL